MVASRQWRVAVVVPAAVVEAYADAIGDSALAVSTFEADDDGVHWLVEATFAGEPERARLISRVAVLAEAAGIAEPELTVEELPAIDWVSRSYEGFPPLRAGRYFVYGSHVEEKPPAGSVALHIDAATAFGTGEHGSTRGCLLAIDRLARRIQGRRRGRKWLGQVLDLGCGSGILALAAAKTWHVPVLAVDLDPESVRVAAANARLNGAGPLVRTGLGDGYRVGAARRHRPCRLILANILARPLARLAPGLRRHLLPGGVAVLAGLLARQERLVLAAHRAQGLVLRERFSLGEWRTLVITRRTVSRTKG
ncbi:MAG: 50S ribosomal protein L11 methyltransferase [Rhodospirillaceae bacterium]